MKTKIQNHLSLLTNKIVSKTVLLFLVNFFFIQSFSQIYSNEASIFSRTEIEYLNQNFVVYQNINGQLFMTEVNNEQEKEKLLSYCVIDVYNIYADGLEKQQALAQYTFDDIKSRVDKPVILEIYFKKNKMRLSNQTISKTN